jgi:hypothetical protein
MSTPTQRAENPRTGKYQQKGFIEQTLKITLVPSEVKPMNSERSKAG